MSEMFRMRRDSASWQGWLSSSDALNTPENSFHSRGNERTPSNFEFL
jgi:hypothetical protein